MGLHIWGFLCWLIRKWSGSISFSFTSIKLHILVFNKNVQHITFFTHNNLNDNNARCSFIKFNKFCGWCLTSSSLVSHFPHSVKERFKKPYKCTEILSQYCFMYFCRRGSRGNCASSVPSKSQPIAKGFAYETSFNPLMCLHYYTILQTRKLRVQEADQPRQPRKWNLSQIPLPTCPTSK